MIRLVKRYGGTSRKLYDTEESRYVSLEELSGWIRGGQEIQVVDSATGEDVTSQTLAQSIYEDHRRGAGLLSVDFLHEVIRRGGEALSHGADRVQAGVDRMVQRSVDRLALATAAPEDITLLRHRLAELESVLAELEAQAGEARPRPRTARRTSR